MSILDRLRPKQPIVPEEYTSAFSADWPPHGTDWRWVPPFWAALADQSVATDVDNGDWIGPGARIFHDGTQNALRRPARDAAGAVGLHLDTTRFEGSFLSVAVELPDAALAGLSVDHLISFASEIDTASGQPVFARLNVQHGPNTAQVLRQLPDAGPKRVVEFDLGYSRLNEKRINQAWLDLIFESPEHGAIVVRDLRFARLPRAAY